VLLKLLITAFILPTQQSGEQQQTSSLPHPAGGISAIPQPSGPYTTTPTPRIAIPGRATGTPPGGSK